jgi:alpha-L-rhamnosidase
MGDAQIYARTATYNADVAPSSPNGSTMCARRSARAARIPTTRRIPFAHGAPARRTPRRWTDAGIIVPYTMWQVYGDNAAHREALGLDGEVHGLAREGETRS